MTLLPRRAAAHDGAVISAYERVQLRTESLLRWQRAHASSLHVLDRAVDARAASEQTRLHVQEQRFLRALDRTRRAIDRQERSVDLRDAPSRPIVVVADARDSVRLLTVMALQQDGRAFVAAETDDGADALGINIVEQPDVAILDNELPHHAGTEVAELLRLYAPLTRCVLLADVTSGDRPPPFVDAVFPRALDDRDALADLVLTVAR